MYLCGYTKMLEYMRRDLQEPLTISTGLAVLEGGDTNGSNFILEYETDGNQTRMRTVTGIRKVQYNAQNRAIRYESEEDSTHIIIIQY